MWRVLLLTVVLAGPVVLPARAGAAPPIPRFYQGPDTNGDGWALCWREGNKLPSGAGWSFWCPTFPRSAAVAVRAGWLSVAKCAPAIGTFVAFNYLVALKVKKLGGIWKAARRFMKAKKEERGEVILAALGDLSGVTAVIESCGG
jgi:hypothetical protein